MDRAVSLKEREEEIPIVADQLRLSPESIAVLLRGSTGADEDAVDLRVVRWAWASAGHGRATPGQRDRHRTRIPGRRGLPPRPRGPDAPGPHSRALLRPEQPRGLRGSSRSLRRPGRQRRRRRGPRRPQGAGPRRLGGGEALRAPGDGGRPGPLFGRGARRVPSSVAGAVSQSHHQLSPEPLGSGRRRPGAATASVPPGTPSPECEREPHQPRSRRRAAT